MPRDTTVRERIKSADIVFDIAAVLPVFCLHAGAGCENSGQVVSAAGGIKEDGLAKSVRFKDKVGSPWAWHDHPAASIKSFIDCPADTGLRVAANHVIRNGIDRLDIAFFTPEQDA